MRITLAIYGTQGLEKQDQKETKEECLIITKRLSRALNSKLSDTSVCSLNNDDDMVRPFIEVTTKIQRRLTEPEMVRNYYKIAQEKRRMAGKITVGY